MAEEWTVLRLLRWTEEFFREKGIAEPRLDSQALLADLLGLDRVGLYVNYDRPLATAELADFKQRVSRRGKREPLQYILGRAEFWSLSFKVTPAVLIPRADTEVLVEEALKRLPQDGMVLDVGIGSGAIAVAIAHERTDVRVTGIDCSLPALVVAQQNAESNGVAARVIFRQGDLYHLDGGPYDLIVSNPPYIAVDEAIGLMPEVRDFEPQLALLGGVDGLNTYRSLVPDAIEQLNPDCWLLVEVGAGQAGAVSELFQNAGYGEIFMAHDLSGIDRVVGGRKTLHK